MLRDGLRGSFAVSMRLIDLNPIQAGVAEEVILGDITELAVMRQAIAGCDACVHLAAIPVEATFDKILHTNIQGTWAVFEAARLEGCPRRVCSPSTHAPRSYPITCRTRPDEP